VKTLLLFAAILLAHSPVTLDAAYPKRVLAVDPNSDEGHLLQLIQTERDPAVKIFLLEKFVSQFPKFDALDVVYSDLQSLYMELGDFEKALAAGEKVLAIDSQDIECALRSLQAAEGAKDAGAIKQWTDRVQQLAKALASSPQPKLSDDVQIWKKRVEVAKGLVGGPEEYNLYKKAFDASDPRKRIELLDELKSRYPQGQYSKEALPLYFAAYRQIGDLKKAFQVGEQILQTDQTHEDILLLVAETLYGQRADSKRVLAYSNKIIELMNSKPKPANMSDGVWARQKATSVGLAYSMIGGVYLNQEQFKMADRALRQALPLLQSPGLDQQRAATLSFLGWANYKMKNYEEATNFYTRCLAINGPYQESAAKNLSVIKSEQAEQH
jgi:tetratricopeptide (TPR) repeat protein